jgi:hypothetical protein
MPKMWGEEAGPNHLGFPGENLTEELTQILRNFSLYGRGQAVRKGFTANLWRKEYLHARSLLEFTLSGVLPFP